MSQRQASIHDWLTPLRVNLAQLLSLAQRLSTTYSDLALHSRDQFLATPITKLPTGHETGEYLTIDLGGTNLRIAFVTLLGNQQDDQSHPLDESLQTCSQGTSHGVQECMKKGYERSWPIGEQLKVEKAEDLFAWVGDCLAEVVEARFHCVETPPVEIPLGITFSFPMMYVNTLFSHFILSAQVSLHVSPVDSKLSHSATFNHTLPCLLTVFSIVKLISAKQHSCQWEKALQ